MYCIIKSPYIYKEKRHDIKIISRYFIYCICLEVSNYNSIEIMY